MRRVDAKLDRVIDNLADIRVRVTNVEENLVVLHRPADRTDLRIERIARRLDLTESAAWRLSVIGGPAAGQTAPEATTRRKDFAVRQTTSLPPPRCGRRHV
jgi:hypothetical protein